MEKKRVCAGAKRRTHPFFHKTPLPAGNAKQVLGEGVSKEVNVRILDSGVSHVVFKVTFLNYSASKNMNRHFLGVL